MGINYAYGNLNTLEYIDLGKSYVFSDLFSKIISSNKHLKCQESIIKSYLLSYWDIQISNRQKYILYVAANIFEFVRRAKYHLILKADDSIRLYDGSIMMCDKLESPLYWQNCEWKKVWDCYKRKLNKFEFMSNSKF